MNPIPIPADCVACGACCFSQLPTYVRVTGDDWSRLGHPAEEGAHFVESRAYMKRHEGHCAALAVREGAAGREYFCTIYEDRPQVCRDLARGSPQCEAELEQKADRACRAGLS